MWLKTRTTAHIKLRPAVCPDDDCAWCEEGVYLEYFYHGKWDASHFLPKNIEYEGDHD